MVAGRLAISLRSIGIRASFVHGSEWHHGDLGVAGAGDVVVLLSHSGRTAELVDVGARLTSKGVHVFAITGNADSPLAGVASSGYLLAASGPELLGTIPTRSIVAQEAVANAVVSAVAASLGLTIEQFKHNHPGGAIGAAAVAAKTLNT
jgi:arabinose-5-phosphate isomerase